MILVKEGVDGQIDLAIVQKMKKKTVLFILVEIILGIAGILFLKKNQLLTKKERTRANKFKSYYDLCNQWIQNLQDEKKVQKFFSKASYHKVAIYGCGSLGNLLFRELVDDVKIEFFVDGICQGERIFSGQTIRVISPEEIDYSLIDVIVVTAVNDFDEIAQALEELGCNVPILSLEDVVCGI